MCSSFSKLKFYKGCRYEAFFYAEDKYGYRELVRTAVYTCVNAETGYLEFAPATITDIALASSMYPTFIAKERKDKNDNLFIKENAPSDRFDFTCVEISSTDFSR